MKKRFLGLVLSLIMVIGILPVTNVSAASGTCGDDLTWTLDASGTLVISGTGEMDNYGASSAPWYSEISNIKTVVISSGVTSIGEYAFYNCTKLTSVTIGDSVTSIGKSAFTWCERLETIYWNAKNIADFTYNDNMDDDVFGYAGTEGNGISVIFGNTVERIPAYVFSSSSSTGFNRPRITSVTIGDNVKSIGNYAFYDCKALTSVTIGDSVKSIERRAFYGCTNLTDVYISNIEIWLAIEFDGDESDPMHYAEELHIIIDENEIAKITIPDSVTSIRNNAFRNCTNLTSISIGDSVTSIGENAFYNCTNLTSVRIGDGVTSIGNNAFGGCSALESLDIGNIHSADLSSANFPKSLKYLKIGNALALGSANLKNCINLETITLPFVGGSRTAGGATDGVFGYVFGKSSSGEYVEADQYYSPTSYITYRIPTSLKSVCITNATQIPYGAFSGCSGLEYIELNEGITQIGQYAFANCGFLNVRIPKSVTHIGSNAFAGTDVEKLYVSINSYGHQYAEANGYPYEFYDYYPVTGITLSQEEINVVEGNTYALTATVAPDNATYSGVIWNSSDKSVATVDGNGLVTAVSKGKATITATTEENDFTASCTVNVLRPVTSIELNYSELNIGVGYTKTLTAAVYPETASNKSVVWSTDDASVATVSNGIVTAVGYGTTKIRATTVDGGYIAECVINSTIPVNGISLNKTSAELLVGDVVSLVATVTPTDAFDKSVNWSSSNTSVVTVEDGLVTAKSAGTATVTAKTNDGGKTAYCVITVTAPVVNVTDITLNKCDISLNAGESETLVATITPSTATNKNIVWTTSNENIATVDQYGKVTAKSNGIAIITAITADGNKEVTCTVTVIGESDNEIVIGDVNGDGEVDFADAIVVLKYDAGITTLTGDKLTAADTNGDGDVDFVDAIQILKYDGGLISSFN